VGLGIGWVWIKSFLDWAASGLRSMIFLLGSSFSSTTVPGYLTGSLRFNAAGLGSSWDGLLAAGFSGSLLGYLFSWLFFWSKSLTILVLALLLLCQRRSKPALLGLRVLVVALGWTAGLISLSLMDSCWYFLGYVCLGLS
jgi:hypothetical protein